MKPALISLGCMAMLTSATPLLSNPPSPLPVKGDQTLDRQAVRGLHSADTASSSMLEKRTRRSMNVPNSVGTAIANLGSIIVKAIVDAAGELVFQITNNSDAEFKVSLREKGTFVDAANLRIPPHHNIPYHPLGAIKPGDEIAIGTYYVHGA